MSGSISVDEEWSIISSSSDFEDESTGSSDRNSLDSGRSTPPDPDCGNDEIDESTCTIKDESAPGVSVASDLTIAELGAAADNKLVLVETEKLEPNLNSGCGARQCALLGAAASFVARVDRRIRNASRSLFNAVFGRSFNSIRAKVASTGTLEIPLYQHAAYSLLSLLKSNEELLLYYLVGLLSLAAVATTSVLYLSPTSVPKTSYGSRLQELWVEALYEPRKEASWFTHETEARKLKAARYVKVMDRYLDVASKRANLFWVQAKESVATHLEEPIELLKHALDAARPTILHSSKVARQWARVAGSEVQAYARSSVLATRKLLEQIDGTVFAANVKSEYASVANWVRSARSTVTTQYFHTLASFRSNDTFSDWLDTCKHSYSLWLNKTVALGKDFRQTELEPLTGDASRKVHHLLTKLKVDLQVAAISTNHMLGSLTNESFVYGHNVWLAVKSWSKDALDNC